MTSASSLASILNKKPSSAAQILIFDMAWEPDLVIGMDIGTTYSGYACQFKDTFRSNPTNIWMHKWSQVSNKTKTCVLLNKNGELDSFGEKAEKIFSQEFDKDRNTAYENLFFYSNFKMVLYRENFSAADNAGNSYKAEDYFSRHTPLKDVMSKFIQGLKDDCWNRFSKQRRIQINEDKVRWVITVPAIWNEDAKSVMRKAAEMAGIPGNQLMLALEPEAAAISCFYLPEEERSAMGGLGQVVGDKFMIIDLGGGTVDITAVEVVSVSPKKQLKEIIGANGGAWGGQRINDAFTQVCRDVFKDKNGQSVFKDCKKADLLKMENLFEAEKLKITDQDDEWIEIHLPLDMRESILKDVRKEPHKYDEYFKITRSGLFFKPEIIQKVLFQETLNMTVKHLEEKMKAIQAEDIKKIILVGGFSESPIVIETMEKKFQGKKFCVATNPFYSVLRGAVLFGHQPNILKSRISRYTFGVDTNEPFHLNQHRADKRWIADDGTVYAKDIFSSHVTIGQVVAVGDRQPPQVYVPIYPHQKLIKLKIYQSTDKAPQYVTDPSCRLLGELIVELATPFGGSKKEAAVTMVYGGTELTVVGKDQAFGITFTTKIEFAHDN
ncbi:hypothetical protein CHS0354_025362 [Potamilus streckersoni]|uniref:Heat shock 70 kDa protein 12A n=1 Tax=Potamilus streckersoni TaxID=2493646 RepID=A0AAE0SPN9_9BIVA|nr:hypothetical protein CHS0354_025362 [Potamilus streckersoni]